MFVYQEVAVWRTERESLPSLEQVFLSKEFSGNPASIAIYNNKVVNFLYGSTCFAFMIESKELAENYKKYHAYLWKHVTKK